MAFRVGRYRVGMNTKANAFAIILQIAMLVIWFYVGQEILNVLLSLARTSSATPQGGNYGTGPTYTTYNFVPETNIFYNGYKLLGLHTNDPFLNNSGGLVGVIGLLLAIAVLMQAIRVTRI